MARAKPIRVIDPLKTSITIFGCGGTGGTLLQTLARLLYGLKEARNEHFPRTDQDFYRRATEKPKFGVPPLLVVDGDTIESQNLLRQTFVPKDLGEKKATVLAHRLGAAYGLEIQAYPHYLGNETDMTALVKEGGIVVGCVDNPPTRKLLHERLIEYDNIVYLDAGNAGVPLPPGGTPQSRKERVAVREGGWEGQVVCGIRKDGETLMPFPAEVFEDLVDGNEPLPSETPACGEVIQSLPQRHQTNLFAATVLMGYLTSLLTEGTVLNHVSFFDARQAFVRSSAAIEVLDELAA
jgi:hypothetical protein